MARGPGGEERPVSRFRAAVIAVAVSLASCGGPRVVTQPSDPRYQFDLGRAELQRGHEVDAQTHLKRFLDLHPGHALADSAQFLVGMALYGSKSWAEAAVEFALLGREFPRSDLRDDAAYWECMSYYRQMRPAQFDPTFARKSSDCFGEMEMRFPDSDQVQGSRTRRGEIADRLAEKEYRIGVLFTKLKKPAAARIYLEGILRDYPQTTWVAPSLLWIGRAWEADGRPADAAASYRRVIDGFPDSEPAAEARQRLRKLVERDPSLEQAAARTPSP
jgi:outer membrane protein assembly factor BamD